MKKPYQIEAQRAVKQFEAMAADGNPAVQMMLPMAEMVGWLRKGRIFQEFFDDRLEVGKRTDARRGGTSAGPVLRRRQAMSRAVSTTARGTPRSNQLRACLWSYVLVRKGVRQIHMVIVSPQLNGAGEMTEGEDGSVTRAGALRWR